MKFSVQNGMGSWDNHSGKKGSKLDWEREKLSSDDGLNYHLSLLSREVV